MTADGMIVETTTSGLVTDQLRLLLKRQVEDHCLVVWYDPEGHYGQVATSLNLPGATVARYDGSFFKLRHEIAPLMNDMQPPRLVVYVPLDQTKTNHALIELEAAGVVVRPGQQPPQRNTRLSVLARNALTSILGEKIATEVEKQVEAGKLSLADVNKLANNGKGVLSLVYGTVNPQDVALAFLASDRHDAEVAKKDAAEELGQLLRLSHQVDLPEKDTLPKWRDQLARHVLMTDLVACLGSQVPPSLASVKVASSPAARDACVSVASTWRLRRDVRDSYVAAARRVEQDGSVAQVAFNPASLGCLDTFPCLERALLHHVEEALLGKPSQYLLDLALARQSRFWSEVTPKFQARWALVASAAEVLLEADRVAKALKDAPTTVPGMVNAYVDGENPWCLLDMHHRHMEGRWYTFESEPSDDHPGLGTLVLKAERRYMEVGSELAKRFVTCYAKGKFPIPGLMRQVEVFEKQVRPRLGEGKLAYVWVDALRYEMARELAEVLKADFDVTLHPALGTLPTITEIGMASLLPRADQGARVVSVNNGKLGLEVGGTVIKDRKDRVAFLKAHAGVPVADAKLDDLLPKPSKKLKDAIGAADLVLITSQEIDALCEADNITQARRQMDGVLNDLRRGFRVLSDLGVKTIVLAADHGHLFGEEVGEDMKIEAPGGTTADLHRRVWVGVGGTSEPSYMRASLKSLGVESELDLATPYTFACFVAKGGARSYFHGGLSPQEVIIPVVVMTPTSQALSAPPTGIQWTLATGSKKLSTRFFSVQVGGTGTGLFGLEPPKVRVEIRAKGKCVSTPVSASYGFEEATGDVQLRVSATDSKQIEPDTVTLMVEVEEIGQKTVTVSLLDAASGTELSGLDKIEVTNIL
ncbi:MAG: PglZ domain-containing protein [Isosphaeraceae bacterium]